MHVLLTNDDGIDSPGLAALYDGLSAVVDVTVVAPAEDQSGVGRARSGMGDSRPNTVSITDHEWGYVVDGTPADCAAVGLRRIDEADAIDLVVSGANVGPNVGSYILGHSGTVGAVVEAAFLGTPGVAVSGYDRSSYFPADDAFAPVARVTASLVRLVETTDLFAGNADFLNINIPTTPTDSVVLTRPLADYDTTVETTGGRALFESNYWATKPVAGDWVPVLDEYRGVYPTWSDRAAVVNGDISITPLAAPQTVVEVPPAFADALDAYTPPLAQRD